MVYQPTPGQQPQQFPAGQPFPYGQPIGQPPVGMQQPEIKWSGLETGGTYHLPVKRFIGRLTDLVLDAQSQFGLRIVEKFDQVQVLESPVPWPWATIDPSIKYSGKENSAWGKHIASAKVLGLATNAATLDQAKADLVGKMYEMQQVDESYGEDRQSGQTMHGDVWKFVRVVQPSAVPSFPQPQYAQPQPAPQPAPVPSSPLPAPAPVAAGFNTVPLPTDTPAVRAKKLLHGRALYEWLGAALMDDKIKADPAFINTIYDQSFIVGLKASGQATQGADGKFQIVA